MRWEKKKQCDGRKKTRSNGGMKSERSFKFLLLFLKKIKNPSPPPLFYHSHRALLDLTRSTAAPLTALPSFRAAPSAAPFSCGPNSKDRRSELLSKAAAAEEREEEEGDGGGESAEAKAAPRGPPTVQQPRGRPLEDEGEEEQVVGSGESAEKEEEEDGEEEGERSLLDLRCLCLCPPRRRAARASPSLPPSPPPSSPPFPSPPPAKTASAACATCPPCILSMK